MLPNILDLPSNPINSWDFDGVISIGMYPGPNDIIITGRCIDEQDIVLDFLRRKGIKNQVLFNPMSLAERGDHTIEARKFSGMHKAKAINGLCRAQVPIQFHFEDDEIQADIIENFLMVQSDWYSGRVKVIRIDSPTEK